MNITVLGAGSWGTTLALVLHDNHHDVNLWAFDNEQADLIREKHENHQFLPGITLPSKIKITTDIETSCRERDMIVAAVPSQFLRSVLQRIAHLDLDHTVICNVAKGIENGSLMTMSEVLLDVLMHERRENIASRPNLGGFADVAEHRQYHRVHELANKPSVRHRQYRARVDHHKVEILSQFLEQVDRAAVRQRRQRLTVPSTRRNHRQILRRTLMHHLAHFALVPKQLRHARRQRHPEHFVERRSPKIEIDQHRLTTRPRKTQRQLRGQRCLAFPARGAGNHERGRAGIVPRWDMRRYTADRGLS